MINYKLEDLSIGMAIENKEQLNNIFDTWIILVKQKDDRLYHIGFIGKETCPESDRLFTPDNLVCPIYNDSLSLESGVFYVE